MSRGFWETFGGQVAAYLAVVATIAAAVGFAWFKLFGFRSASTVTTDTISAAKALPAGVASLVGSKIRGESEDGYITDAEMRRRAAAKLTRGS